MHHDDGNYSNNNKTTKSKVYIATIQTSRAANNIKKQNVVKSADDMSTLHAASSIRTTAFCFSRPSWWWWRCAVIIIIIMIIVPSRTDG
jgi:hypothetical protein